MAELMLLFYLFISVCVLLWVLLFLYFFIMCEGEMLMRTQLRLPSREVKQQNKRDLLLRVPKSTPS